MPSHYARLMQEHYKINARTMTEASDHYHTGKVEGKQKSH